MTRALVFLVAYVLACVCARVVAYAIPNDELAPQRAQLGAYLKFISGLKSEVDDFGRVIEHVSDMPHVHEVMLQTKQPQLLKDGVTQYTQAFLQVTNDRYSATGRLEALIFGLKNQSTAIDAIEKSLNQRDKKHKAMEDVRAQIAKGGRRTENSATKALMEADLQGKEKDYLSATNEVRTQLDTLLGDRTRWTGTTFAQFIQLQTTFYTKVVATLNSLQPTVDTLTTGGPRRLLRE